MTDIELGYDEYYVAFLDILGFKDIINNKTLEEAKKIFDVLETQYTLAPNGQSIDESHDIHKKIISDSICFYIRKDAPNSLIYLLLVCSHFQHSLLSLDEPVLLRGGISEGGLYDKEDETIFGPALVRAYIIESSCAKYPRIIVEKAILDDYYDSHRNNEDFHQLLKECDDYYAIAGYYNLKQQDETGESFNRFEKYITEKLAKSCNESVRQKYLYIKTTLGNIKSGNLIIYQR